MGHTEKTRGQGMAVLEPIVAGKRGAGKGKGTVGEGKRRQKEVCLYRRLRV
jgi:hypothetical protein